MRLMEDNPKANLQGRLLIQLRRYFACGQEGHFKKDCQYREYRCAHCHVLGHISAACRNMVVKDPHGRVETRVEPRKGVTKIKQRKDKSQVESINTAAAVLKTVKEVAQQRAAKVFKRRVAKKQEKGWVPKRIPKEHPVALAQEESDEKEEDEDNDDPFEDFMADVPTLCAITTKDTSILTIAGKIGDQKRPIVIDTGASRSLCSSKEAKELKLCLMTNCKRFQGLGELRGWRAKEVNVEIGKKKISVKFYIVDAPNLPILLGNSELSRLQVVVDPTEGRLLDKATMEVVALGIEVDLSAKAPEINTVMQKRKDATEEELLRDGVKVLQEKMKYLSPEVQNEVIHLFTKYKDVWIQPKAGGVTCSQTQFEVTGLLIKLKMRYLAPVLKEELEKQRNAMLEAGVIQLSKSPWGACVHAEEGWRLETMFGLLDVKSTN